MFARKTILAGLVAAFAAAGFASQAQAQTYYHAALVKNATRATIAFQVKVDNGAWFTYTIRPGQSMAFSKLYPQLVGNHQVLIRYDYVVNDGRVTFKTQTLKMHVTRNPNQGWLQTFTLTNGGRNLWLSG
jgi:hypothetical protein